tara:strand:+ start:1269 stop:1523 length:255 start_codon:yes stop_codon:yes gene_type:complete
MDNLDEFTEARIIDEIKNFSDADLEDVLMNLTPTERNILCLRHGIRDPKLPKDKAKALAYIAKKFVETKARIKELEDKAMNRLK